MLIDHQALFRDGLRYLLQRLPRVDQILEAGDFNEGLMLAEQRPDLILLEPRSPQCSNAASVNILRQRYPFIPVVVVSGEENPDVISLALSYGASGYVSKRSSGSTLLSVLNQALDDNICKPAKQLQQTRKTKNRGNYLKYRDLSNSKDARLTRRQSQILNLLIEGRSNREIASETNIVEGTVKVHLSSLYKVLQVNNRVKAVQMARKIGLA